MAASYAVGFPAEIPLDQRVLWPATPSESNGMEDARFVRFVDDTGERPTVPPTRPTTGATSASRMLSSPDLRISNVTPLRGPARPEQGNGALPTDGRRPNTLHCAVPTARPPD